MKQQARTMFGIALATGVTAFLAGLQAASLSIMFGQWP